MSTGESIHFQNYKTIDISYRETKTYFRCNTYDAELLKDGIWHKIMVLHHGRNDHADRKRMILDAIFELVEGEEFYPIAYQVRQLEDSFLVHDCKSALEKLFAKRLSIKLKNGYSYNLKVQLHVGHYQYGHISVSTQILKALNRLFNMMERQGGYGGVLNLSSFINNPEFNDVAVYLGNRSVFQRVCNMLYKDDDKFRFINGLILSNNNIGDLSALRNFSGCNYAVLDLRNNQIRSTKNLVTSLRDVKANSLFLESNPITMSGSYPGSLKLIFKNYKFIDSVPVESFSKDFTPIDHIVFRTNDDSMIINDKSNRSTLSSFKRSTDWHLMLMPDATNEFTKEQIFDCFFKSLNPNLDDLYPCYYQFKNGEHRFLVRQCYSQLRHLFENCSLRMQIPRHNNDNTGSQDNSHALNYYLRMNVCPFKLGHIFPLERIQRTILKLYDSKTCILNLEEFTKAEGLQNVVVNMRSPNVVSSILKIAAKELHTSCVEIRMAKNQIVKCDFSASIPLMSNLKSIDLSDNHIQDLEDIKTLQTSRLLQLNLRGNPFCKKFTFQGAYIEYVKNYFPGITQLDKINIQRNRFPAPQNFLSNVEGYDFVQKFIKHFFENYDSERFNLKGLYSDRSIFTMNCNYNLVNCTEHISNRVSVYKQFSRNILDDSPHDDKMANIHFGTENIMKVHFTLPKVTHSMISFKTETPIFNDHMAVIIVHGVFMDIAPTMFHPDMILGFTRTFVLETVQRNVGVLKGTTVHEITNEFLNVYNPTKSQLEESSFNSNDSRAGQLTTAIDLNDQKGMMLMLQAVIQLKTIWCKKFLTQANWDFGKALELFLAACSKNEVPDQAFI